MGAADHLDLEVSDPEVSDPEVRRTGAKRAGVSSARKVAVVCWAVAAVVILALATTLVVLLSTDGSSGSDETDRVRFTQYAATMITELTTLNRDNVDRVTAQLKAAGAGTALGADDESLDQIVELVKTQNVTTTGKVVRTAVSKLSDSSATILLVSGWRMESPGSQPQVKSFRWRVRVDKREGKMALGKIDWVV